MYLGLDLASRISGWTCGDGSTVPACDVWRFEPVGEDYGHLLSQLFAHLNATRVRFPGIRAAGYEAPILVPRRDPIHRLRLLYPLGPFVEWWCRDVAQIPCHEVTVQEAKAEVTGKANAEKEEVAQIAERCGVVLPRVGRTDAGDSWSVWKRMLRHYDRSASERWDAMIWKSRGALL